MKTVHLVLKSSAQLPPQEKLSFTRVEELRIFSDFLGQTSVARQDLLAKAVKYWLKALGKAL